MSKFSHAQQSCCLGLTLYKEKWQLSPLFPTDDAQTISNFMLKDFKYFPYLLQGLS